MEEKQLIDEGDIRKLIEYDILPDFEDPRWENAWQTCALQGLKLIEPPGSTPADRDEDPDAGLTNCGLSLGNMPPDLSGSGSSGEGTANDGVDRSRPITNVKDRVKELEKVRSRTPPRSEVTSADPRAPTSVKKSVSPHRRVTVRADTGDPDPTGELQEATEAAKIMPAVPALGTKSYSMATPDGEGARSRSVTPNTHHRIQALEARLLQQSEQHEADKAAWFAAQKKRDQEITDRYEDQMRRLMEQLTLHQQQTATPTSVTASAIAPASSSATAPTEDLEGSFVDAGKEFADAIEHDSKNLTVLTGEEE